MGNAKLRLNTELGRGAFGVVHKGTFQGRVIAAKRIHKQLLDYARLSEVQFDKIQTDFERECKLLQVAKHANIVEFIDVCSYEGQSVLIMELMEQSLEKFLNTNKGRVTVTKQMNICVQIASGLLFLHQFDPQILHRDLQPANILVNIDCSVVKISDLGQAKFRPTDVKYLTTQAPGHIVYMPPESLVDQNAKFTSKGDVFSFGVVMLEVGTQDPPTSGFINIGGTPEIERRAKDLSKLPDDHQLEPLILQCLRDNPEERPDFETVKMKLLMKCSLTAEPMDKVPEWYEKAIQGHGLVEVNISRAILTGGSRVGKTSLKHYLLHNTARKDKTSTGVLEAPEVATIAEDGVGTTDQRLEVGQGAVAECSFTKGVATGSLWKVMDDEEIGQLISLADMKVKESFPIIPTSEQEAAATEVGNSSKPSADLAMTQQPVGLLTRMKKLFQKRPAYETTEQSVGNPLQPSSTQDPLSDNFLQQHEDPLELLEQARVSFLQKHKLSTEAQLDEKQCTFIYLLDTGGQPSFQNIIPLLLDFPCTFVHVFKASESLTDPYINAFCKDGATEEKRANSRSTWELMKESITAAYTMSMKSKQQLEVFNMPNEPQLRIFLVGTHLSLLPKDPEVERALLDHNKKVLEEMDNKPYDGNRIFPPKEVAYKGASSYYLVDSQLQGDSNLKEHTHKAINTLRSQLSDAKYQLSLKVPKVWFCLQLITSSVKKKMWKLTELKEFCIRCRYIQAVDADGQLLALLKLFHCLGFYVYFDLSEYKEQWICTDATFLYKEISKVLSVQYDPSESPSPELRIFKNNGEISEATSENLFQQLGINDDIPTRWLFEVLVKLGIAAKVTKKKTCYFIPVALPERKINLPEPSVATLGFTFSFHSAYKSQRYTCIPTGLFHRLAVDIASGRQALKYHRIKQAYISKNQWKYYPSQSDSTQFYFSQENAHIVLSQKGDLIQLQLLVPEHFSNPSLSLPELCRQIREEMDKRIHYVSKRVFGAEFLEEKATLEVGVISHHQNCMTSSLHLLRFEGDNQRTGLCTRLNKMTGLTLRESVWIAKKQDSDTISLSVIGKVEFDGDQFLLYKDQSTVTGGPAFVRQTTPSDNSGDKWKEIIQSKYWVYLLDNLSIDKMVDHLYQGVNGKPLIPLELYQEIGKAKSTKEANKIFLLHLLTTGTVENLYLFSKVLQQTSDGYPIHEEVLEKLKEDFNL